MDSRLIVTALDLSLTATGWATSHAIMSDQSSGVLSPPKLPNSIARLRWIRAAVIERVAMSNLVVIEGYAFGRIQQAHHLGELGGVIRVALADRGMPFVEIPPASLKLFATGKGNAKKDEVLAAAIRKLGYAGHDHNEADAIWLLKMAQAHYSPSDASSESRDRALGKIAAWPKIDRVVVAAEAL